MTLPASSLQFIADRPSSFYVSLPSGFYVSESEKVRLVRNDFEIGTIRKTAVNVRPPTSLNFLILLLAFVALH